MNPIFETARIRARKFSLNDTDSLLGFFSDDAAMRYMPEKRDADGVAEWLYLVLESYRLHGYGPWALVQKSSKKFIGYCGLYLQKDVNGRDEVELLYGILQQHWGKGYASESAKQVLLYAQQEFKLDRIISLISLNNKPSIRIAEKMGMSCEDEILRWGKIFAVYSWRVGACNFLLSR